MPIRLDTADTNFAAAFAALLAGKRETSVDVADAVTKILADVRTRGDAALVEYTQRFDRLGDLTPATLSIPQSEIDRAHDLCDAKTLNALKLAAARIRAYHTRQRPSGERFTDAQGVELGHRWTPVAAVGLYVPGGTANYPSSVLMNAIPAKVAGVARLVMVVPTPDGIVNPLVLAAAKIAGVDEVYRVGGAQAVAALAFGTATIGPVDKIVGPGNAWVAEAKRQVFGTVGIDMIAGPSEILVLADGQNDPEWIAADLLSQAEHDESAQSILITDDAAFAASVEQAVARQLQALPRETTATKSWADFGAIIVVKDLAAAVPLIDRLAPEHLEIAVDDPEPLAAAVSNAGAIF
ncbi:MAG: histidinol dehydrogenase, partial [Parvibaculum sp.]|nr:histidinol dehydrogenase [Parvibaculum sp.]